MARIRRKPEEARNTILDASENLLLEQGLAGLKLAKVAQVVGISHPGVLHHFGSAEGLLEAVHQRISLKLRSDIITSLEDPEATTIDERLSKLLAELSEPRTGQLIACLVAAGLDPFPAAADGSVKHVIELVQEGVSNPEMSYEEIAFTVQLTMLSMLGDAILGQSVRSRMGVSDPKQVGTNFQERIQGLIAEKMRPARKEAAQQLTAPA